MISLRCLSPFCKRPWMESGKWPKACPYCGGKRIEKVAP